MTLNCWVVPVAILGFVGSIVSETSVVGVTVRVVTPEMPPEMAVIVVEPVATVEDCPLLPAALLIDATDVDDELHITVVDKS